LLAAASRALKQLSPLLCTLSSKRSLHAAHPQIFLLMSERHCKLPPMATSCERWRNLHGRSHSPNGHECVPCPAKSRSSSSSSSSSSSRSVPMSEGGAVECNAVTLLFPIHIHCNTRHTYVSRVPAHRQTDWHARHSALGQATTNCAISTGISQVCF